MTSILDQQPPVDPRQKMMMVAKDSTLSTAAMTVFGGYAMGALFSLFGAVFSLETKTQSMGSADFFRYSFRNAHSLGISFAFFGLLFGGIEAALEKRRGRKDVWNPTFSGGLIGGVYGWRYYKYAGLVGGLAGGAAASLVFEKLLDSVGMSQH